MSDRKFEPVSAPDPTDVYHRVRIRCSHDGCKTSMIFSRRGPIEPVHAAKWFRDKGWGVGSHVKQDLCPEHNGRGFVADMIPKKQAEVIVMKHLGISTGTDTAIPIPVELQEPPKILRKILETSPEPIPPEALASLSKTDKRIIYAKLDEVYADEKTGYRGDWNDQKVATDLGVPIEWVSLCRDETFGPEVNRQKEIDRLVTEALATMASYRAEWNVVLAKTTTFIEEFETKLKEFRT